MTTVTGLTAERMLAIEGASVIDGDVDASGNLILTKHDGSQINAGSVTGPPGPPGPTGTMLSVLTAQPVLDLGLINNIRAGRQLTAADFTNMGLNPPLGLWNLSDLSDASGNGRALNNKGAVGFAPGISGAANTSAQFTGAVAQALYISDTGAADPFRIRTGSFGCWFKVARRGQFSMLIDKFGTAGQQCFTMFIHNTTFGVNIGGSSDGTANNMNCAGITDVADDRWHFAVGTFDGTFFKIYVDGFLDVALIQPSSPSLFPGGSVLNIGARGADASNNASIAHYGRVDEAFVTADVLSEDQVRNLYCAKIGHTLGSAPSRVTLNVRRRRKGPSFAVADFSTQPLRLHNFSAGSLGDEGSNAVALTNNGGAPPEAGVDGSAGNAFGFGGTQNLSATDANLPIGLNPRSYGCWVKTVQSTGVPAIIGWGSGGSSASGAQLGLTSGILYAQSGASPLVTGINIVDGLWHFIVAVEDNAALDGAKQKLYVDGKVVGVVTAISAIALGGANRFRVGLYPDGTGTGFIGQIDGVFVCGYALTSEQISALYSKGSQTLTPSPKNAGDHIEAMDSNNLFAIFDSLDSNAQVDLKVAS